MEVTLIIWPSTRPAKVKKAIHNRYWNWRGRVLYFHKQEFGHVADGTNSFLNQEDKSTEIRNLLNIPLRSCEFNQQFREDHCGSSAVLIALEFTRSYTNGFFIKPLSSPHSWRKLISDELHKSKSVSVKDVPELHLRRQSLKCTLLEDREKNYFAFWVFISLFLFLFLQIVTYI